jgi:hypothetical protein
MPTVAEFFAGHEQAGQIFAALQQEIAAIGPASLRVTKSQIAFRRRIAFAWAWMPGMYRHGKNAPLVLTLALRRRAPSARWKEIIEPYPGRFTHHLELSSLADLDEPVRGWLREAWLAAG